MGIQEAIIHTTKLEGIEDGIEKGIKKGIEQGIKKGIDRSIKKILSKGHTPKVVADMLDVSVEYVEKLKKELEIKKH